MPLSAIETLWINTGTQCNLTCANCYIESSPTNDRLAYVTREEVVPFLEEARDLGVREIGFTGGEPFLNPQMIDLLEDALDRGFDALVLTNAMRPMQRPRVLRALDDLHARHGGRLVLRISLDHYTRELHETERGPATWEEALSGIDELSKRGFRLGIAGRTCWGEDEASARAGYAALIVERGWPIDPQDHTQLLLFPEMRPDVDVAEVTEACWEKLGTSPQEQMCASSRMIVKRKGAACPVVLPCTLLPYEPAFEMGRSLAEAAEAHGGMFADGAVRLCHPHCSSFCVVGGGSCS